MGRLVIYSLSLLLFACIFNSASGIAKNIHLPNERGLLHNYDFIIVGAGGSGSVVAARISKAFPRKNILVVEGGVQGQRELGGTDFVATKTTTDPETGGKILDPTPWTRYDLGSYANSIRTGSWFLNNTWGINNIGAGPLLTQAKVIGGNMATNGMAWLLPFKYDFDSWGLPGYTAADIWPIYESFQNLSGTPYANPNSHGPVKISGPTFYALESLKFYNACRDYGFPDYGNPNDGESREGVGFGVTNIRDGIRQSTSAAYLAPALKERNNLKVIKGCTVTHVLFGQAPWADKKARGVECVDYEGEKHRYYANYEVILSAGAFGTTKILYNSGIGPHSVLSAFNKPLRYVNEIIGQQVRNHQSLSVMFNDPGQINANFFSLGTVSLQFATDQTGIYGNPGTIRLMAKVNPAHPVADTSLQIVFGTTTPTGGVYSQALTILISQTYQDYHYGSINLTSTDPLANTSWNSNQLTNADDVETLAKGVLLVRDIINNHWPNEVAEISPGAQYDTVEKLIPQVQSLGAIICHFYGTVPIGNTTASPLDLRMRVRTLTGLRVVDASVIPGQISQGMQAQATMIGEKGSSLIIEDYPQFTH